MYLIISTVTDSIQYHNPHNQYDALFKINVYIILLHTQYHPISIAFLKGNTEATNLWSPVLGSMRNNQVYSSNSSMNFKKYVSGVSYRLFLDYFISMY